MPRVVFTAAIYRLTKIISPANRSGLPLGHRTEVLESYLDCQTVSSMKNSIQHQGTSSPGMTAPARTPKPSPTFQEFRKLDSCLTPILGVDEKHKRIINGRTLTRPNSTTGTCWRPLGTCGPSFRLLPSTYIHEFILTILLPRNKRHFDGTIWLYTTCENLPLGW